LKLSSLRNFPKSTRHAVKLEYSSDDYLYQYCEG
jgi:hypothetical protein